MCESVSPLMQFVLDFDDVLVEVLLCVAGCAGRSRCRFHTKVFFNAMLASEVVLSFC